MIELNITGNFKIVYVFVYCNIYLAFMKNLFVFLFLFYVSSNYSEAQTTAHKFEAGKNTFLLDGKPFVGEGCRVALHSHPTSLLGASH